MNYLIHLNDKNQLNWHYILVWILSLGVNSHMFERTWKYNIQEYYIELILIYYFRIAEKLGFYYFVNIELKIEHMYKKASFYFCIFCMSIVCLCVWSCICTCGIHIPVQVHVHVFVCLCIWRHKIEAPGLYGPLSILRHCLSLKHELTILAILAS